MKLAISAQVGRPHKTPNIALIKQAEALGYDSVWTGETWGADAFSPLAFIAAHTTRIKLGTSIVHIDGRTPAMTAMTAQTIDAMAGGNRLLLGIGTSGPQVVEGWHGRPWGKPNYRIREAVKIMQMIWRGETVQLQGREFQLPYQGEGAIGEGKPLKNAYPPVADIPILIGAETPLNIKMSGEISRGLIGLHTVPKQVAELKSYLAEGLARRKDDRSIDDLEIISGVSVIVTDDVQGTINQAKRGIALYAGGFGSKNTNFHKDAFAKRGFQTEADRIQALFLAGKKEEAAMAVPDEYVDEEMLIGPAARIKERFRIWQDSGFTTLRIQSQDPAVLTMMADFNR